LAAAFGFALALDLLALGFFVFLAAIVPTSITGDSGRGAPARGQCYGLLP
jgi:hypothetical protein